MKLIGNSIYLELLSPDNGSEEYASWMNDPEIYQYLESKWRQITVEDLKEYIKSINDGKNNFLFGIFDKATDKHIGNIKVGPIQHVHRYGDIGIIVGNKNYWGKGVATEAIKLIVQFAFEDLNLNKVTAGMYDINRGSLKAFEKNGFRQVGIWKNHVFFKGEYIDQFIMEKLREE